MDVLRPPRFTPAQLVFALVFFTAGLGALGSATHATIVWHSGVSLYASLVVSHVAFRDPSDGLLGPALSLGAFLGVVGGVIDVLFEDRVGGLGGRLVFGAVGGTAMGLTLAPWLVLIHLPLVIAVRAARATRSHDSIDAIVIVGGAWCLLFTIVRMSWSMHDGVRTWTIGIAAPIALMLPAIALGVTRVKTRARWIERARRGEITGVRVVDDEPVDPAGLPLLVAPKHGASESLLVHESGERYRVDGRATPVARVPRDPITTPVRSAIARALRHVPIPRGNYVRLVIGAILIVLLFIVVWNFFADVPRPPK